MVTANATVRARGAATQNRILEKAVHIASVEGLSSMSLATLAKATSMSKSGLFAHFRSKEALQIAIIDEAQRIFFDKVVRPAQAAAPGLDRLSSLLRSHVEYSVESPFAGGCFFAAAAHEFDGRPGAVRERLIAFFASWDSELRAAMRDATIDGHLAAGVDVDAVIFEVTGIGLACNFASQLGGGADRARSQGVSAVTALLGRLRA